MKNWLLAVASAISLAVLVRYVDAPVILPDWSPSQVLSQFQATAKQMGIDARKTNPDASIDTTNPAQPRVVVHASRGKASLRAEYTPAGVLLEWECKRCSTLSTKSSSELQALGALTGSHAPEYRLVDRDQDAGTSRWRKESDDGDVIITLEDGAVKEASHSPSGGRAPGKTARGSSLLKLFQGLSNSIYWIFLSIAGSLVLATFLRRSDVRRLSYAIVLFWLLLYLLAVAIEWRPIGSGSASYHVLGHPALWLLPCAAGLARIRGPLIDRWLGFLHSAERWRPQRRSGVELWNGLLLGWPLALAAFAPASPEILGQKIPALTSMLARDTVQDSVVLYFGFILPVLHKWTKNSRWRWGLLLLIGVFYFGGMRRSFAAQPLIELLTGVLAFGLSWWIYLGYGLLGVFAAAVASTMLAPIAWLAGSPFAHFVPLASSLALYGGGLACAAWLQRHDHPAEDAELAAEVSRRNTSLQEIEQRSEREFLLTEFAEAREAQMGMLPAQAPVIEGFSLAAVCLPAREVGGDLYDIIDFNDGQWGLCVADVSGKGVPAALYMTMTKGVLASEQRVSSDLKTLSLALNECLHEAGRRKIFVTMAIARLDPLTRRVELLRAGHNPVLWRRAQRGETVWLKPKGLGLGMVGNRTFQKKLALQTIELEPGDTLLLYSDGLTEAENPRQEGFGEERLERIAQRADNLSADAFLAEILREVEVFKEGADPHDDLTLLALKADPGAIRFALGFPDEISGKVDL